VSRRPLAAVALVALLGLGGSLAIESSALAGVAGRQATSAAAKNDKTKKTKKVVVLKVAKTPLGKILVDSKGFTLYAFDPDGTDTTTSKCTGGCATAWPHAKAKKKVAKVGKGLDASLFAIGGASQIAYNDHLLYRFSGDSGAGDTNGQGVGNIWHVVDAKGATVTS
jgi:predicted lipoprotein with Yx(FWY)xxD motif